MSANRPVPPYAQPVMLKSVTLPPGLRSVVESLQARAVLLTDALSRFEAQFGGRPLDLEHQAKLNHLVAELAALNDTLELLSVPLVRLVAREQHLARRRAVDQSAAGCN